MFDVHSFKEDIVSFRCFVGTSGWNYKVWKETFYQGVRQKDWLAHYASVFKAVEVNATFYRLLKEATVSGWHDKTPEDFAFAAKGSRYITHTKKLKPDPDSVEKQRSNLAPLKDKLKVVLWQLPASLSFDPKLLQAFGKALEDWPQVDHVLEFRHESWFCSETADILNQLGLGTCISDAEKWPRWDEVTDGMVYIRLHGRPETYASEYSDEEIQTWTDWLLEQLDNDRRGYVFFDNTDGGAAVDNAQLMQQLLEESGKKRHRAEG